MKTQEQIEAKLEELNEIAYDENGTTYIWTVETAKDQIEILEWVLDSE